MTTKKKVPDQQRQNNIFNPNIDVEMFVIQKNNVVRIKPLRPRRKKKQV